MLLSHTLTNKGSAEFMTTILQRLLKNISFLPFLYNIFYYKEELFMAPRSANLSAAFIFKSVELGINKWTYHVYHYVSSSSGGSLVS